MPSSTHSGNVALDQAARNDVEHEDVGQLVGNEPVEAVWRLVDGQHNPVTIRFSERADSLGHRSRNDVLLLELAVGLEDDERHRERELMPEVAADFLIGALCVRRNALEVLLELGVVVDLKVVGRVNVPVELVVFDTVLPVVRNELVLGERFADADERHHQRHEPRGHQSHGPVEESTAHHGNTSRWPEAAGRPVGISAILLW